MLPLVSRISLRRMLFQCMLLIVYTSVTWAQTWSSVSSCTVAPVSSIYRFATNGTDLSYGSPFVSPTVSSQSGSTFPVGCFYSSYSFPYVDLRGMEYFNNTLYVSGNLQNTDSSRVYSATGQSIGAVDGWVNCLQTLNGYLYAGGGFSVIGGVPANYIGKWNGTTWSAVGSGPGGSLLSFVKKMSVHNNQLYVSVQDNMSQTTEILYFNGTGWISIGSIPANGGPPGVIEVMKSYNGSLYIAGFFNSVNGVVVSNIARWNGTTWSALGSGITGGSFPMVQALEVYNNQLYAGGDFTLAGGAAAADIAAWNGSNWSAPGSGTNGNITSLIAYKGSLVAGGTFTMMNGIALSNIARYTTCPVTHSASGPTSFCGGSVTLTAPVSTSYQWCRDGVVLSGATGINYTASTTGNYYCVLNGTCGTIYSNPVYVNASTIPAPVITAGGPTSFCGGGSVLLSAPTGANLTYKWYASGQLIAGATSSTYLVTQTAGYSCVVTNSSCNGWASSNVIIVYNNGPPANISPSSGATICSGSTKIFSTSSSANYTYQWKKNGTNLVGATLSYYSATTAGTYSVQVTNAGCIKTSPGSTLTVTSMPALPGSITTTGGTAKVCPGESRTYSVTAVSGVTSYTWTPCAGSVITSGQNTNSVTIQYNAGFPVSDTLRVVANNSCGTSAQRKLKITRNNPGTPSAIVGDNYGVCNLTGKPYSVTNVSGMTYAWSFNTGTATVASGQGTSSITANYGAGFISGSLSVTASNACGTSAARLKTIYARPATPVSITGPTSVCLNQQDVPYSIAPLANTATYTWIGPTGSHISDGVTTSSGNTLVTIATAVTVDFATTAGSVKVRGNNACASGSYKSLSVAITCREGDFSTRIPETILYPNPTYADFTIETGDNTDTFNLEVYDAYGKLILARTNLSSGYQVSTNGWADGIYSVVVQKGNKRNNFRLVIME